ncbi:GNAT family protein [Myroides ceti]|uniref:GNAT family protein n=1 Tax=Paenimyroides ceti TaxID=395087 RepID=A0ABT8CWE8_9FLAO|nr:GNAT family protein [Paenimyroides ceti]MDN3707892.1 GNAT family protein [Paenimyroides ceti]MDN3709142.1 GNAT family protein [Paenimyroides ceti]
MNLVGESVYLRALEPEDLDFIYEIENNQALWEVSHTQTPYSRFLIRQYLENAHQDIYEAKQLRLVIVAKKENKAIGLIDLFDFDPKNERVGLGIVIVENQDRNTGYGTEAVALLISYVFEFLNVYQIYVNISSDNEPSIKLFSKFGFEYIGTKKAWNKVGMIRKDELLFQLINNK